MAAAGTVLLYFVVTAALVTLASRTITPISIRAGIVLVLLPLCFTGRALFTGAVYAPIDLPYAAEPMRRMAAQYGVDKPRNPVFSDVYCLNIPWKAATRSVYAHHDAPLWNPHLFAGDILAAAAQPTPYDPVFLSSLLLPMANSLTYLAALLFFLAGICMFLWLRDAGLGERASIFGAVGWMFASFIVFWLEWVITAAALWLPLVLLGVRRIARRRDRGSVYLLTFAFTMMLLAGHPESAMHIVSIAGLLLLIEIFWSYRAGDRAIARPILMTIGAGLLSLAICAIYLLPIIEAIPQTMEHRFREEFVAKTRRSIPIGDAMRRMEADFLPFVFGIPGGPVAKDAPVYPIPQTTYVGSVALVLALFALWRGRFREKIPLAVLFVLGILLGTDAPPLTDWLTKLPLFDIAINNRYCFAAAFAVAALAAHGIEAWSERGTSRALGVTSLAAAAILGFASLAARAHALSVGVPQNVFDTGALELVIPPLVLGLALVFFSDLRLGFALALLLLLGQRTAEMANYYPTLPARIFYPPIPGLEKLPKSVEPYRIVGLNYTFVPNTATVYGLEDIRGYQAMTFAALFDAYPLWSVHQPVWFNRVPDLTRPFLSFLNVRYAICPVEYVPPPGWRTVVKNDVLLLLENEHSIPRAYAPRTIRINSPDPQGEMMRETDFRDRAWITFPESEEKSTEYPNGPANTAITHRRTNSLRIEVDADNLSWIVVSQTAWKGWRARLDGKWTAVHRANQAFLAVQVPRGHHRLDLIYRPTSFIAGSVVSLLTFVGIALDVWFTRRRRAMA